MEGERLRNYESSCNRALSRTIDTLFKVCKASIAGKLVPAAAAVESSTPSVAPSDQRIPQTEPNSASINDAVSDSVATVDHEIPQTQPNSASINEAVSDPVATVDHGIPQTEPNSVSINEAVNDSVATVDHGIPQTEPSFVSYSNTKRFNCTHDDKAKAPFREGRQPRSSPRRLCRASRYGQRPRPLSTTRPARAFGAELRSPPGSRPARPTEGQGALFHRVYCGHSPMPRNRDREGTPGKQRDSVRR